MVFAATTAGKITPLHSFGGARDGAHPLSPLLQYGGVLYGTTSAGGNSCSCGTVFSITFSGKEHVLHRFGGADGSTPYAGLIRVGSTLYGTTKLGGAYNGGAIFEITPSGKERVIHSFAGGSNDGDYPVAGLLYLRDALYGTTSFGGAHNSGTIFRLRVGSR
jgi:uncharacterized repeat protein (TIGR03803 family)